MINKNSFNATTIDEYAIKYSLLKLQNTTCLSESKRVKVIVFKWVVKMKSIDFTYFLKNSVLRSHNHRPLFRRRAPVSVDSGSVLHALMRIHRDANSTESLELTPMTQKNNFGFSSRDFD